MPAFRHRVRALAVGVGAFALVAVAAGGTFAASNPATLYACYDVYGNVRMGDTAQCKLPGGGRLVSWGSVGATGPTGPQGPTGPTGAPGLSGYEVVTAVGPTTIESSYYILAEFVTCPPGKLAVGGGGGAYISGGGPIGPAQLQSSFPFTGPGSGWSAQFTRADGSPWVIGQVVDWSVFAVCAYVAP